MNHRVPKPLSLAKKVRAILQLPLSGILRVALRDLRAAKKEGFREEMGTWLRPNKNGVGCVGCLAGAVLNQSCGLRDYTSNEKEVQRRLRYVIDEMRVGRFQNAAIERARGLDAPLNRNWLFSWQMKHYDNLCTPQENAVFKRVGKIVDGGLRQSNIEGRAHLQVYERAAAVLEAAGL